MDEKIISCSIPLLPKSQVPFGLEVTSMLSGNIGLSDDV